MLGKRSKPKYEVVDTVDVDLDEDLGPTTKHFFTSACMWNSCATALLIGIYYAPSIGLTFYQQWLYQKFHFPLTTVMVHLVVKYLLAAMVRSILALKYGKHRIALGWKDYLLAIAPTGVFSGIDIGFSNWGLELITVSLYTMTKSTTIIFILGFAILFKLEKKSWSLCTIVIMISTGLILFTYKATQFNTTGFTLVLVASISSGLRWTCVQVLLQKSKMGMKNPVDMIFHMQPFMIVSLLPFALWIEGPGFVEFCQYEISQDLNDFYSIILKVLLGAFIAFFMEMCEIMVVTYTSSLTLSIAGIFKEVFTLVLAVKWKGDQLSGLNVLGLIVCLCGIISHVVHKIRMAQLHPVRTFNFDSSDHYNDVNMGKSLIAEHETEQMYVSSESDGEHDSQVLFSILNRHDR